MCVNDSSGDEFVGPTLPLHSCRPSADSSRASDTQETLKVGGRDVAILLEPRFGLHSCPSFAVPPGERVSVGRGSTAFFQMPMDKWISRLHFSIESHGDYAVVVDLGSSNGTMVNGKLITETTVRNGDKIVAGTTEFGVRIPS